MTETRFGDYHRDGYRLIESIISREVANGLLARMKTDFGRQNVDLARLRQDGPLLVRPAVEIYGHHYPLFATFHWGLTAAIQGEVGVPLLPTYCYFRLYGSGDVCLVHGDRPACEHSLSLTLGYANDKLWPLEISRKPISEPYARADSSFAEGEDPVAIDMSPGDAVLYKGVHHHHGRTAPNPNRWSAHLFLHWVERGGAFAAEAFDKQPPPLRVDF
ncbi:hypothetical protein [Pelagerythrobacter marensis]|uniref:Phytanoyl-CoA dioxygenase n=1 Tax=Pelagerythrobacter marensis TaxID=543877 RepID=A0A0G3XAQ2_9SPHN|nr:hypothetical protein [Pelagerythrobacter marensis]AKM07478.1 hypothetical protein AM2010_1406 [Pelagerythrobacter marensis]